MGMENVQAVTTAYQKGGVVLGETYQVDPKIEAQWVGLGTAAAAVVGGIFAAFNADPAWSIPLATAIGGFAATGLRVVVGHFMPAPKAVA